MLKAKHVTCPELLQRQEIILCTILQGFNFELRELYAHEKPIIATNTNKKLGHRKGPSLRE
jgi:hypothetical protein